MNNKWFKIFIKRSHLHHIVVRIFLRYKIVVTYLLIILLISDPSMESKLSVRLVTLLKSHGS